MNDTLLRQWAILRTLPKHPRRSCTTDIHQTLANQGIYVTLRTVQRDLLSLSRAFPIECDQSKPQGWWWHKDALLLEIPAMSPHAALTFTLVDLYMQRLLPPATLEHLNPWFRAAKTITEDNESPLVDWKKKLRVVQHTFNKVPAKIAPSIQSTIYEGLLQDRQIEVTYRALSRGGQAKTYVVHPLGLVVMEQVVYLVCTVKNYPDARFLAIHRISEATLLSDEVIPPAGFDIDAFIESEFGIRLGNPIQLVIKVRGVLGQHLIETPISQGQLYEVMDDQWTRITAKVMNTAQLRAWLRSLGSSVVIEEPYEIRKEILVEISKTMALYD